MRCPNLTNGNIKCPSGATGVFKDTCTFYCNTGYQLQGSDIETCQANGSWSGGNPVCVAGMFTILIILAC